ncbi:MAG TPA: hypothetical protein PLX06_07360 [Fimbriimonadaceae bacterium]|nr:hypothetical protein [Fimbriimonadaceae bacterium]
MGLEKVCRVKLNGQVSEGQAHCGDLELDFRGEFRFKWKWSEFSRVDDKDGVLTVVRGSDVAEFDLGPLAEKWAHAIRNPKSRLDKLGLKPGQRYAAWGTFDEEFPTELQDRAGEPAAKGPFDAVFVRMDSMDDLPNLVKARSQIVPKGMIWAVWPKGRKEFREDDIRNFALANGLVDVKVASFSSTLSALKLVIPVAQRKGN